MTAPDGEREALLIRLLRDHDVPCPACRYNLRGLTKPQCPECRQPLVLTVGIERPQLVWLLVTLAPSIFSGIAALLLLMPIIFVPLSGGGGAPLEILALDAFGWASGLAGVVLIVKRFAFMRLRPSTQRLLALSTWALHVGVFLILLMFTI